MARATLWLRVVVSTLLDVPSEFRRRIYIPCCKQDPQHLAINVSKHCTILMMFPFWVAAEQKGGHG